MSSEQEMTRVQEYRFDASRRGAKLKEVNIREILLEISRETNGRVQILVQITFITRF